MRHGVWRAISHNGKAYSFYLSTTDARFEESKVIFDEMVRSFELTSRLTRPGPATSPPWFRRVPPGRFGGGTRATRASPACAIKSG